MKDTLAPSHEDVDPILVIGAGMGGLASAIRLASAGHDVEVIEQAAGPGGKMRTVPSVAGPVDAGPTVLTMRDVFDDLFATAGERLEDWVTLHTSPLLARHWWADGTMLDLSGDARADWDAIERMAPGAGHAFARFDAEAETLYRAFDEPVMRASSPDVRGIVRAVARTPSMLHGALAPGSLARFLARRIGDPRLAQLFARYATYVGGRPDASPAVLALIWRAEARGVWSVEGGMGVLADALARLAAARGVRFRYGAPVARITIERGRAVGVQLASGERLAASAVVFNGDPAALRKGLMGPSAAVAVPRAATTPRSLSACVWSFAAVPEGLPLTHHNVIFGKDPNAEWRALSANAIPADATFYVCAQDRGAGREPHGPERFEIILNAPPGITLTDEEKARWHRHMLDTLARRGLRFDPEPGVESLTTPQDFAKLFPGSDGSLYGRSPHGTMATFLRPTARSRIPGLYLAGGGVHPGAGVPMATLSGKHAAEAISNDLASISTFRRTAMPGGMSTG